MDFYEKRVTKFDGDSGGILQTRDPKLIHDGVTKREGGRKRRKREWKRSGGVGEEEEWKRSGGEEEEWRRGRGEERVT